jgi:nicotinamidase-related amidase
VLRRNCGGARLNNEHSTAAGITIMTFQRFTGETAAMLLIDHQVGTMGWVKSLSFEEMKRNALMLAKTARILNMPVVLTSSMEDYAQGPLLGELEEILPEAFATRVKRLGIVNAMDDPNFVEAVRATDRQKLIIAGVTNDVCTVYPALTLVGQGYDVQVIADAGGSPSTIGDDMALRRMERGGVTLSSTNQVIAELAGDWSTPEGSAIVQEVVMPSLQG